MKPEEIREIREKSKMTQEAFAFRLKVDKRTVINYEKGYTRPSKAILRRIQRLAAKHQ